VNKMIEEKKAVTTYVSENVYNRLVRQSIKEDRSVASVVRIKLAEQMKEEGEDNGTERIRTERD